MRFLTQLIGIGAALLLVACGGNRAGTSSIDPLPTASISASPATINSGKASTLTWSSTNATSCTASGAWSGALPASGSQSTGAITTTTSYSLTCTGPGGISPAATVTVAVTAVPTATLTAKPTVVVAGGTSTLTWSSTNATACTASGGWSGARASSGTQVTGAITTTTLYSLTCSGAGGTSSVAAATVTVAAAVIPTAALTANPTIVAAGGTSTLSWSSTNATACTASGGWSGALASSGTQVTAAITTYTSYSLTCTGPGGTSSVATVAVGVSSSSMSLSPRTAAITLSGTQQFTATVPGGGAAKWMVDGIVGGNGTVGLISATGLYTAGTAAGTHTIVATSIANATQSASAVAAVTDLVGVYTYHNNLARNGANTQEYALTTSNVNTATFGKLASCPVDGAIYGQPLWVANLTVNGTKHNVIFVTTQHDSVYAFDADASPCVKLWSASLIDAAHGGLTGETSVPGTLVGMGFGNILPEVGVNSTPVIDPSTSILYVVSKSINSAQTTFYQRLHAIDLATGNEKTGAPATIAATYPGTGDGGTIVTFDPRQENQRMSLALVNGVVYIAWASHEDTLPWYGWMMSYQFVGAALMQKSVLNVTPNVQQGGIWMSGGAPAVDSNNNLYVITGNGGFDVGNPIAPNNDYGDSLLQLSTTLQISQYFTPSDELSDGQTDTDFGSGGAALLADLPAGNTVTHALICGGKDMYLFVLNRDSLGGFGNAYVQTINFGYQIYATGAFWNGFYYLAGMDGPLTAFQLNTTNAHFAQTSVSTQIYQSVGTTPSVSSAATQNGVVWALETSHFCLPENHGCGPAVIHAYDANNMANELWNSALASSDAAGFAVKFMVPTVANGKVYIGTRGNNIGGADSSTSVPGELDIYGLKP